MFMKPLSGRPALLLVLVALLWSCGDGVFDDPHAAHTSSSLAASTGVFDPAKIEFDEDVDGEPDYAVDIASWEDAQTLFADGVARFEFPIAFQQVSWMMDAGDVSELAWRAELADGSWTKWEPVEIVWNEGFMYNARVLIDEPVKVLEMRGGENIEEAELQFFHEIRARREIIHVGNAPDVLDGGVDEHGEALRTVQQASVAPTSLVVPRRSWGAASPDKVCGSVVAPYRATIHHTYRPSGDGGDAPARMRQMQSYHMNNLGWCDIGYHFVVAQSGKIYQGRSRADRPGAHTGNQNSGNVGISYIADFTAQTPTNTQLDAGGRILKWIHDTYRVPMTRAAVKGHREWPGQSTTCPGNVMINRIQNLLDRAKGGGSTPPPAPTPSYSVDIKVNFIGLDNFYKQGSSASLADALVGDTFKAEILVTNKSSSAIRNVKLGYFIEQPYIKATNYRIQTDYPKLDGRTWVTNDANDAPENPARDALGKSGTLTMYAFSPNETKRVLIDLKATRYSIGYADHPDVRGWIKNIDGVYVQNGWGDAPTTNRIGRVVRNFAQMDVLSQAEWQFESKRDGADLEGWTGAGQDHYEQLRLNLNHGLLAMKITGHDARIVSPTWTQVNADRFDQIVLRHRSHDGPHVKAIYWIREHETFSEERVVRFTAPGDGEYHDLVIPMGNHPEWRGTITGVRIDLLDGEAPAEGSSGWYDVDKIYFQATSNQTTTSVNDSYNATTPLRLEGEEEPVDPTPEPPAPGDDDDPAPEPTPPGSGDDIVPETPGQDDDDDGLPIVINPGCSAAGNGANPAGGLALAALVLGGLLVTRRQRR